jgi:hypothetical protein
LLETRSPGPSVGAPPRGRKGRAWLAAGAVASLGIALLHVAIVLVGAPAYAYFGAPDLAPLAEQGSPVPALLTLTLAALFALWGFYGLSGAGIVGRLPLLGPSLAAIGCVYTLRGLLLLPELAALVRGQGPPMRVAVFSAVSLAIGLAYLAGLVQSRLPRREGEAA